MLYSGFEVIPMQWVRCITVTNLRFLTQVELVPIELPHNAVINTTEPNSQIEEHARFEFKLVLNIVAPNTINTEWVVHIVAKFIVNTQQVNEMLVKQILAKSIRAIK